MTKTRTKAQKQGLRGLMARVSAKGLNALDRRSAGYRALQEWRAGLERDLGGHDHLSEQQKTLVELATRTRLFLDSLDLYLMGLPSLVNKRKRSAIPALAQRMQLSDSLSRTLTHLGLQRQVHVPSLESYLAEHYPSQDEAAPEPPDNATDAPAVAVAPATNEGEQS